jgi:hypothetical protein
MIYYVIYPIKYNILDIYFFMYSNDLLK